MKHLRDTRVEMAGRQLAAGYMSPEHKRSDLGRTQTRVGHPHVVVVGSRGVTEIPWDMLHVEKPSWNPGSRQRKKGGPRSGQQGGREPSKSGGKACQDELLVTVVPCHR